MSTPAGHTSLAPASRLVDVQARIAAIRDRMQSTVPSPGSPSSPFAAYLAQAASPATGSTTMPVAGTIRSGWGPRTDPIDGTRRFHHGIDIAAPAGTPVGAMASGRVVFAGERGGYGLLVEIEHPDGARSRYAHLSRIDVAVGDIVDAGGPIGAVGSTGRSTGPHLHLELRVGGESIDPRTRLPIDGRAPRSTGAGTTGVHTSHGPHTSDRTAGHQATVHATEGDR